MMNNIAFAGNLIVDYVKKIENFPSKGMLSSILDISRSVGGSACNTAIGFARFDTAVKVSSFGRVGDDENGRYIRKILEDEGIYCEFIVDSQRPTSFTDVMSEMEGDRTFFHARGANAAFGMNDIPFEKLECDLMHIGYILLLDEMDSSDSEYGTQMAKTLAKLQSMGIKTSVDVVSENSDRYTSHVKPCLEYCDYFIVNEIEASRITGIPARDKKDKINFENIRYMLNMLLEMGACELVVIHSPEGGWALRKNREYAYSPSIQIPRTCIKGHVGAGDAFCAGMLYGISKEFALERTLEFAAGAAACSLSEVNSTSGMRSYEETVEMINKWKKK